MSASKNFWSSPAVTGSVLFLSALLAFIWANVSYDSYNAFWNSPISIKLGQHGDTSVLALSFSSLQIIVNDLIMAIFFLSVGIEIKKEILAGKLSSFKTAIVPVVAALGGMIVPALIYFIFDHEGISANGWGIPMATDIAFSLAIISLLSTRVPISLKIFLMALAIADDIGAISVIALFYTEHLNVTALLIGIGGLAFLIFANKVLKIRSLTFYHVFCVIIIWSQFLESGVHATLAGLFLAFVIPSKVAKKPDEYILKISEEIENLKRADKTITKGILTEEVDEIYGRIHKLSYRAENPMQRFEHRLAPVVSWVIMPLFALANAGVNISGSELGFFETLATPVAMGVGLGLLLGKPIGIFLFTFISVKLGLGTLPDGVSWKQIFGMGIIAGMGFTVALFVSELAFRTSDPNLIDYCLTLKDEAKLSILIASLLAAIIGYSFLYFSSKKKKA